MSIASTVARRSAKAFRPSVPNHPLSESPSGSTPSATRNSGGFYLWLVASPEGDIDLTTAGHSPDEAWKKFLSPGLKKKPFVTEGYRTIRYRED